MKSPAFQFYAGDFLVGVMGMSDDEVGIYIKMLAFQWERGSLPNDRKLIKKIINSKRIPSENVIAKFAISDDGNLRNERLEAERKKQENFRESRAENAKKRWKKAPDDDARASIVHDGSTCENDALQSSSSPSGISESESAGAKPKPERNGEAIAAQAIVDAYPRREKVADSLRIVLKAIQDGDDPAAMLAGTKACAAVIRSLPGGANNRYVPSAEKFFLARRWRDDPETFRRQDPQAATAKPARTKKSWE